MTTWTMLLNQKKVEEKSNLVVEGKIIEKKIGYIPGVEPPMRGEEWIIDPDHKICKEEKAAAETLRKLKEQSKPLSFWTIAGTTNCKKGLEVRVALSKHINKSDIPVFMPQHCSYHSIVKRGTSLSLLTCTPKELKENPKDYHNAPSKVTCPNFGPVNNSGWRFKGVMMFINTDEYRSDVMNVNSFKYLLKQAGKQWSASVTTTVNAKAPLPGERVYGHYLVNWQDGVPPNTDRPECTALAVAYVTDNRGRRPHRRSFLKMLYNTKCEWGGENGFNLFSVMIHEIGHAAGLDHFINHRAVMYPWIRKGAIKTEPMIEERDCLASLYPHRISAALSNVGIYNKSLNVSLNASSQSDTPHNEEFEVKMQCRL